MPSYSKNELILVRYPFSELTSLKVRPAVFFTFHYEQQKNEFTVLESLR